MGYFSSRIRTGMVRELAKSWAEKIIDPYKLEIDQGVDSVQDNHANVYEFDLHLHAVSYPNSSLDGCDQIEYLFELDRTND